MKTNDTDTDSSVMRTTVHARWRREQRYDISRDEGPAITLDGNRIAGPGPVDTLLGALAACASMEVVDYLAKRRTPVAELDIVVNAERSTVAPRRVLSARLLFHLRGDAIEPAHAMRAIALALASYCSVASSLARDIIIETQLILNDETHEIVRQPVAQELALGTRS
jgi:putative redox protein